MKFLSLCVLLIAALGSVKCLSADLKVVVSTEKIESILKDVLVKNLGQEKVSSLDRTIRDVSKEISDTTNTFIQQIISYFEKENELNDALKAINERLSSLDKARNSSIILLENIRGILPKLLLNPVQSLQSLNEPIENVVKDLTEATNDSKALVKELGDLTKILGKNREEYTRYLIRASLKFVIDISRRIILAFMPKIVEGTSNVIE